MKNKNRLTLKQRMAPVTAGIGIGLPGVMATARLTSSLLFDITANDRLTLVGVTLFLVTVALGASYVAARRAAKMEAIHVEVRARHIPGVSLPNRN